MGQQQLLLIVLGIIIVGIAIAVGVNMFQSSAVDTNRQAMISDLANYAAKAQRFFRTPTELGGGSQDFQGFHLSPIDTGNANGSYSVTETAPSGAAYVPGATDTITTANTQTIYVVGCGKETGDDGSNPVKAYVTVTAAGINTNIEN
ncbi:MAG: hypothetical protein WAN36_08405 [Calditrichia bacterium]